MAGAATLHSEADVNAFEHNRNIVETPRG